MQEEIAGLFIDTKKIRFSARTGTGSAARAADQLVFTVPAPFVVVYAFTHFQSRHLPEVRVGQNLRK